MSTQVAARGSGRRGSGLEKCLADPGIAGVRDKQCKAGDDIAGIWADALKIAQKNPNGRAWQPFGLVNSASLGREHSAFARFAHFANANDRIDGRDQPDRSLADSRECVLSVRH